MTKYIRPTIEEQRMFKYAQPKPKSLPGKMVRELFEEYNVRGVFAADLAAFYLGYSRQTIQAMCTRTIRTNDYELLRHCFVTWRIDRMSRDARWGDVGKDGQRHRSENWETRTDRKRIQNRAYMQQQRAQNPRKWRKPGPPPNAVGPGGVIRKPKPSGENTMASNDRSDPCVKS